MRKLINTELQDEYDYRMELHRIWAQLKSNAGNDLARQCNEFEGVDAYTPESVKDEIDINIYRILEICEEEIETIRKRKWLRQSK